jgi:hypothetical protein
MEFKLNIPDLSITPSIVIGCGGNGTETAYWVKEFAKEIIFNGNEYEVNNFNPVKFICIDTSKQPLEHEKKGSRFVYH